MSECKIVMCVCEVLPSNLAQPGLHVQTPDTTRSSAGQVEEEVEGIDTLVKDCR